MSATISAGSMRTMCRSAPAACAAISMKGVSSTSDPVAVKLKVRRSAEGPPTARAHAMMAEESMPPDSEMPVGTSLRR